MLTRCLSVMSLGVLALVAVPAIAPAIVEDEPNLEAIYRIKQEAFQGSQLEETLFYLTDVHGPRLTGSPGYIAAAKWAIDQLTEWGISTPRLEKWGELGRGWSYSRLAVHMLEPMATTLHGVPLAWSSGTDGPVSGDAILATVSTGQDDPKEIEKAIKDYSEKYRGKLDGKIVLINPAREFESPTEPALDRLDDDELDELAEAPEPMRLPPFEWPIKEFPTDPKVISRLYEDAPATLAEAYSHALSGAREKLNQFLLDEGVAAVLSVGSGGDGSLIFADGGMAFRTGSPVPPPSIVLMPEQYNGIVRLVEKKIPVRIEVDLTARFHDESLDGMNVIAEIPGGEKKDEIVMMGAHLDSWHGGTGAADNAAGTAVVMEAARILKTLGLEMDRTVRLALWDAEEQGLLGSRGYVKNHFADPMTMELKPEHAKLAAYFNIDTGSGKIRGIYLQQNDMVRPIFEAWLKPFEDLGATTIAIRNDSGTDHQSFDEVGLPGFDFIQDPLDYWTRTHHSNIDVYDHLEVSDLMQAAAILASFVYHAANREEMLPREPLPKPLSVNP
ncbi:MAG: M20/M25/M40 family metallo-hydrolase [Vicinamibacteria bacterium]